MSQRGRREGSILLSSWVFKAESDPDHLAFRQSTKCVQPVPLLSPGASLPPCPPLPTSCRPLSSVSNSIVSRSSNPHTGQTCHPGAACARSSELGPHLWSIQPSWLANLHSSCRTKAQGTPKESSSAARNSVMMFTPPHRVPRGHDLWDQPCSPRLGIDI